MSHDMMPDAFDAPDEQLLPAFDAAGHVDEGTVHAWLDGMFAAEDAARVAAHVERCAACADMVAEARGLMAGAARVVGSLDGPLSGPASVRVAEKRDVRIGRWAGWLAAAAVLAVVAWPRGQERQTAEQQTAEQQTATAGTATQPTAIATAPEAIAPEAVGAAASPQGAVAENAKRSAAPAPEAPATAVPIRSAPVVAASEVKASEVTAAAVGRSAEAAAAVGRSAVSLPAGAVSSDLAAVARSLLSVRLSGTVLDGPSQTPVEGVRIQVSYQERAASGTRLRTIGTFSQRNGAFRLELPNALMLSSASILVNRIGYSAWRQNVMLDSTSVSVAINLQRQTMTLAEVNVTAAPTPPIRQTGSVAVATYPNAAVAQDFSGRGVAGGVARSALQTNEQPRSFPRPGDAGGNREQYDRIEDNPFLGVRSNPLSTFSVDVDRASYSNLRRFILNGQRPPKDAVRIEELINYFTYELPEPAARDPLRITTESMAAPWQPRHQLLRIALQARRIDTRDLPPNNLVFLVDVSGSMMSPDKLPLVKRGLRLLVDQLRPQDRVALVTYAGSAGVVLPSTSGDEKVSILEAIDRLEAGGSTAGGAGLQLAYDVARDAFRTDGNNRVILATDGDFNVGVSSDAELERLIERRRQEGTYLTVLGFGTGNVQASKMEKLAKVGNGNYAYIDQLDEARKVLVEEMGATLRTVANDVKLQVEFNPAVVQAYRLIGYENRLLRDEDFTDDRKDAGDVGAGHQVTALYEVVPVGVTGTVTVRNRDSLRYTPVTEPLSSNARQATGRELAYVKLRYKQPGESASRLLEAAVPQAANNRGSRASSDLRFAAAVASFGMLLRESEHRGNSSAARVLEQARAALGDDVGGYRAAFVQLVERWRALETTSDGRR
ncbi:YfbK domain-containing protein [Gemmatimonas sp. UBA7669]|uniref:YfbK domain-containing protein n=1 Tax=Gemmatimonas sp. UBA7669 TaxID=1946568 RepID=UPI0025C5570F|nr:von Willebrand factor type A domain-containing protein [Gemmatimonas sp. UBA7669]